MSDNRWRRDPMGRPYDPYRGFDERGRGGGDTIRDDSGYDRAGRRRGAADPGYRPDAYEARDHATDQYRPHDRGQLGGTWDWQRARRGEVEGDYGRGYGNRETGPYHRDDTYRGRSSWDGDRGGYAGREDPRRGFVDRAADEVASWFGDDEAERRRRMDDRSEWPEPGRARRERDRSGW